MKSLLPIALLVGFLAYSYRKGKEGIENLSLKLAGGNFNKKESYKAFYTSVYVDLDLQVRNDGAIQGKILGGRLDLFVGSRFVAFVPSLPVVVVNANSSTDLVLPVGIKTLALFTTVNDLLSSIGKGKQIPLTIRGAVNTSYGVVNVNQVLNIAI